MQNYAIESVSGQPLQAWSAVRLPFEPRDWLKEFRDELRTSIQRILPGPEGILRATYTSESTDLCDVENVLLFNVGTAVFGKTATRGIAFERIFGAPPTWTEPAPYSHHYSYDPSPRTGFANWQKMSTLADWHIPVQAEDVRSLCRTWWRLRNDTIYSPTELSSPFLSLELRLHCPSDAKIQLPGLVKPLFDGVICAFHHDPQVADDVTLRIGATLGVSSEDVGRVLSDPRQTPLGPRRLVWPFGTGVQWNPTDDKCVAGELLRIDSEDWILAGTVSDVKSIR